MISAPVFVAQVRTSSGVGVLDVEVFEGGDVEVGGVEVGLDQAGQDGAAAGVDAPGLGRQGRRPGHRAGVGDPPVLNDQCRIGDWRGAGAGKELPVGDDRDARCRFHGCSSRRHHTPAVGGIQGPRRCLSAAFVLFQAVLGEGGEKKSVPSR
jgi:hypothetical protein